MNWFLAQSRRDQIALLICAVCVVLFLLVVGVVKPLASARESADNRYRAMSESLARVKNLAATLQYHQAAEQRRGNNRGGNTRDLVYEASRAQGMVMPNLQVGSGDAVRANFADVRMEDLLHWLYFLEVERQAQIDEMNLTALNDPGHVSAIITLRKN